MNLNDLARQCHEMAVSKGWYDTERSFPELIALMHSELSEALEDYRSYGWENDEGPKWHDGEKPVGADVELADCIIRILDTCAYYGLDIQGALDAKMAYNATRPYRHGNKLA